MLLCDHPSLSLCVCMLRLCMCLHAFLYIVHAGSEAVIVVLDWYGPEVDIGKGVRGTPGSVWGRSGGK